MILLPSTDEPCAQVQPLLIPTKQLRFHRKLFEGFDFLGEVAPYCAESEIVSSPSDQHFREMLHGEICPGHIRV